MCNAQVVLKCSVTHLSMCHQRVAQKTLSIRREPTLNCESEKASSFRELNQNTWLVQPVLCHCATTIGQPPAPTILYMWLHKPDALGSIHGVYWPFHFRLFCIRLKRLAKWMWMGNPDQAILKQHKQALSEFTVYQSVFKFTIQTSPKYWNQNSIGSLPDYSSTWRNVVWVQDYISTRSTQHTHWEVS